MTLAEVMQLSETLDDRLAKTASIEEQARLREKIAMSELAAFNMFKESALGQALRVCPRATSANIKTAEDRRLQKLAAVMLLDAVLSNAFNKAASADERETARECLLLNAQTGMFHVRGLLP